MEPAFVVLDAAVLACLAALAGVEALSELYESKRAANRESVLA